MEVFCSVWRDSGCFFSAIACGVAFTGFLELIIPVLALLNVNVEYRLFGLEFASWEGPAADDAKASRVCFFFAFRGGMLGI